MAETHPIAVSPALPLEQRVRLLEDYLGQLWDQVWWLSLTPEARAEHEANGFRAPIAAFYREA